MAAGSTPKTSPCKEPDGTRAESTAMKYARVCVCVCVCPAVL